jgi:hypothetical protein
VRRLVDPADPDAALAEAGVPTERRGAYLLALARLCDAGVLTCE